MLGTAVSAYCTFVLTTVCGLRVVAGKCWRINVMSNLYCCCEDVLLCINEQVKPILRQNFSACIRIAIYGISR
jgi:hypothetical protein